MAFKTPAISGVRVPFSIRSSSVGVARRIAGWTEHGPIQGQGGDDGVDPGAVGQPGVHHGGGFIDAPSHVADDLVDDFQEVVIVLEADIRLSSRPRLST